MELEFDQADEQVDLTAFMQFSVVSSEAYDKVD